MTVTFFYWCWKLYSIYTSITYLDKTIFLSLAWFRQIKVFEKPSITSPPQGNICLLWFLFFFTIYLKKVWYFCFLRSNFFISYPFPAAMFVPLGGTPTWRLHTRLYKFGYNISPNISRAKNRTALNFCKNVYMCVLFTPLDS